MTLDRQKYIQQSHKGMRAVSLSLRWLKDANSPSQWPRGLRRRSSAARLLSRGFECHRGHGCLSVVSVACFQVGVSETS